MERQNEGATCVRQNWCCMEEDDGSSIDVVTSDTPGCYQ